MSGRGRGRHTTLPAWMTNKTASPATSLAQPTPQAAEAPPGMAQQALSTPFPPPPAVPPPPPGVHEEWTQHTAPDGRLYYFNARTGESRWDRPTAAVHDWQEHTSPDGRKYWYNPATQQSQWTPPVATPQPRADLHQPQTLRQPSPQRRSPQRSPQRRSPQPQALRQPSPQHRSPQRSRVASPNHNHNRERSASPGDRAPVQGRNGGGGVDREQAADAFRELLREKGVKSDWTWERALRVIISDSRYGQVRTMAERMDLFTTHVRAEEIKERELQRSHQSRLRERLEELLRNTPAIRYDSSYRDVVAEVGREDEFNAIADEKERRDIVEDFLEELYKQKKASRRAEREANMDKLRKMVAEHPDITSRSSYRDVARLLGDEPCFVDLGSSDRHSVVETHLRQVKKERNEDESLRKEAERTTHRRNREVFRLVLSELVKAGQVNARTTFEAFKEVAAKDARFAGGLEDRLGMPPKTLFQDEQDTLGAQLHRDKKTIYRLLKRHGRGLSDDTTEEQVKTLLEKHDVTVELLSNIPIALGELKERAKRKGDRKRRHEGGDDDASEGSERSGRRHKRRRSHSPSDKHD